MTRRTPQAVLTGVAQELARLPELRARLAAIHVAGPDGRCRACRSSRSAAPLWPCRIAEVARRAGLPR